MKTCKKCLSRFVGSSSGKKMSRLRKREGKGIGLRRLSSRVEAILRGMVKVNYGEKWLKKIMASDM